MFRLFVLFLFPLVILSCSSSQKITKLPPVPSNIVDEYRIGPGDSLSILVWKTPELTTTVPVRPDGKVSIPLGGDIAAAGKTTTELTKDVTELLTAYVRNPQITVTVVGASSSEYLARVRVTGAVVNPSSLPHRQGMTVLDLVLQSGGLNPYARGNKAKLYRKVGGAVEVFPVNIDDILNKGNIKTNYVLAPSDILTVPERSF